MEDEADALLALLEASEVTEEAELLVALDVEEEETSPVAVAVTDEDGNDVEEEADADADAAAAVGVDTETKTEADDSGSSTRCCADVGLPADTLDALASDGALMTKMSGAGGDEDGTTTGRGRTDEEEGGRAVDGGTGN